MHEDSTRMEVHFLLTKLSRAAGGRAVFPCIASWTLTLSPETLPPSGPIVTCIQLGVGGMESTTQVCWAPQGLGLEMAPFTSRHLSGQNSVTWLQLAAREPRRCHRAVFQEDFDGQLNVSATCLKINKIREIKYIGAFYSVRSVPLISTATGILTNCFFLDESHQFSSVAQLCLTLCDPMDSSTPGFLVHHQLPGFIKTQVH